MSKRREVRSSPGDIVAAEPSAIDRSRASTTVNLVPERQRPLARCPWGRLVGPCRGPVHPRTRSRHLIRTACCRKVVISHRIAPRQNPPILPRANVPSGKYSQQSLRFTYKSRSLRLLEPVGKADCYHISIGEVAADNGGGQASIRSVPRYEMIFWAPSGEFH